MPKAVRSYYWEDGKRKCRLVILETRLCKKCGKQFQPDRSDQFYCSPACRHAYFAKKKRNERTEEEKLAVKEYMRRYHQQHKEKYNAQNLQRYYANYEERCAKRKKKYWANPERYRKYTREWSATHREEKRQKDAEYKDATRHGGKRKLLIEQNGSVCADCGAVLESYIHAHHLNGKQDHEHQVLLCPACHAKRHADENQFWQTSPRRRKK